MADNVLEKQFVTRVYRGATRRDMTSDRMTKQFLSMRYERYCVEKKWEKRRKNSCMEWDDADGSGATYILITEGDEVQLGLRVLHKERQKDAKLPTESYCNINVPQKHEISRFVSSRGMSASTADIQKGLGMIYRQCYKECCCESFLALMNLRVEKMCKWLLKEEWISQLVPETPLLYKEDEAFGVFILQKA